MIREGDNGGNSASYVTESSMEYLWAMPGVSLTSNLCLPSGTVVPNRPLKAAKNSKCNIEDTKNEMKRLAVLDVVA